MASQALGGGDDAWPTPVSLLSLVRVMGEAGHWTPHKHMPVTVLSHSYRVKGRFQPAKWGRKGPAWVVSPLREFSNPSRGDRVRGTLGALAYTVTSLVTVHSQVCPRMCWAAKPLALLPRLHSASCSVPQPPSPRSGTHGARPACSAACVPPAGSTGRSTAA